MKTTSKKLVKITKNQKGQGVMEYIIITSLIGIFCLAAVKTLGSQMSSKLKGMNTQIKNIQIGK